MDVQDVRRGSFTNFLPTTTAMARDQMARAQQKVDDVRTRRQAIACGRRELCKDLGRLLRAPHTPPGDTRRMRKDLRDVCAAWLGRTKTWLTDA